MRYGLGEKKGRRGIAIQLIISLIVRGIAEIISLANRFIYKIVSRFHHLSAAP